MLIAMLYIISLVAFLIYFTYKDSQRVDKMKQEAEFLQSLEELLDSRYKND